MNFALRRKALIIASADSVDASGTCGATTEWYIKNGELHFTGIGQITTAATVNTAVLEFPVTKVFFEDGVTGVPGGAGFTTANYNTVTSAVCYDTMTKVAQIKFCTNCSRVDFESLSAYIDHQTSLFGSHHTAYINGTAITSLTFPEGTTTNNVQYNDGLTSVTFASTATTVNASSCANIAELHIPDSVTAIASWAFSGMTNLLRVYIGTGVTSIGAAAFNNDKKIQGVYISTLAQWLSMTSIGGSYGNPLSYGASLYANNSLVTSVDYSIVPTLTTTSDYAFYGYTRLQSVDLAQVTSIGSSAFYGCTSLTSVDLSSVTSIGSSAFYGCTSVDYYDFTSATAVPTLEGSVFSHNKSTFEIRVPSSLYSDWTVATNWSTWASHIVAV